jgi:hypothetical protein
MTHCLNQIGTCICIVKQHVLILCRSPFSPRLFLYLTLNYIEWAQILGPVFY